MKKRVRVIFSGRVQGVGFRYTTRDIARQFEMTGYVKNLSDGSVELVSEGDEAELQSFVQAIHDSSMRRNIHDTRLAWSDVLSEFDSFGISY